MVVGGEISCRRSGAKAQSQKGTECGKNSECMCVDEPGKVGRCQVVDAWKVKQGVCIIFSLFWGRLLFLYFFEWD